MKDRVLHLIDALRRSAVARGTEQGIRVYEVLASRLREAENDASVDAVLSDASRMLSGIAAHGHFTDEEYAWVTELWAMDTAQQRR